MEDLAPGTQFAGHRIEEVAGRGGMGVVYRATQLALERTVALKVIAPGLMEDAAMRRRFLVEVRTAASLDHPNVIPLLYAGESDGVAYLAMRYVAGDDLRTLVRREGPLEPGRAARIVAQIGAALDAAHAAGLVHRDVKPANVLLGPGDHVYLTDFGLTKQARSLGTAHTTRTGHWVGTLDYVAPEQIRGERIDARADVYALGCVLFFALCGVVPFPREGDEARLWAHLHEAPPRPSAVVTNVPRGFDAVIARALAKAPDDRFPSAGDLGRAAAAVAAGAAVGATERRVAVGAAAPEEAPTLTSRGEEQTARLSPDRRDRGRLLPAAIAAAAVAIAGAGALWLTGRDGSPGGEAPSASGAATPTATASATKRAPAATRPIRTVRRPNVFALVGDKLWVAGYPEASQDRIDIRTGRVARNRARAGASAAGGLVTGRTWWLALSTEQLVVELDGRSGRVLRELRFPVGRPKAIVRLGATLWVGLGAVTAGGPGYLAAVDRATGAIRRTVPIQHGVAALCAAKGSLWVAHRHRNGVQRLSGTDATPIGDRIPVGRDPQAMDYGAGKIWVANRSSNTVSRLDPDIDIGDPATIVVGREPRGVLVHRGVVYVSNFTGSTITRIDARTGRRLGKSIPVGLNPFALAARGNTLWVSNVADSTVQALPITPPDA